MSSFGFPPLSSSESEDFTSREDDTGLELSENIDKRCQVHGNDH